MTSSNLVEMIADKMSRQDIEEFNQGESQRTHSWAIYIYFSMRTIVIQRVQSTVKNMDNSAMWQSTPAGMYIYTFIFD